MTGYGTQPNIDAAFVVAHLEAAGKTLLALPHTGFSPRMRTNAVFSVASDCGWFSGSAAKCPRPMPQAIDAMDNTLMWLTYIPDSMHVLRRVVGARSLVNPLTDRHLYSWRKLGTFLDADHKTVQRWHAQGIGCIVNALNRQREAA